MPVQTAIQVRRGTAASWTSTNPTLAAGEIGFETDTNRFKIGTGSAAWASLNYFAQDPVTTKGDLYTFSTTDTRLAVGNNGETLVADSSATTGLRWQGNSAAGKNKIINGDFGIWQRGTTTSTNGTIYLADRWCAQSGSTSGFTYSQSSFTAGTAPVAGYEGQFFADIAGTMSNASTGYIQLEQRIEDVRTFAGQTVTLSFWAKGSSSGTINTVLEQYFGSTGSPSSAVLSGLTSFSITTSWTRYSVTVSLPSISGKTITLNNCLRLIIVKNMGSSYPTYGTSNYTGTLSIWGVQLETGNTATAFQTATGTLAGEFAAAQRYYQKSYEIGTAIASTTLVNQDLRMSANRTDQYAVDYSFSYVVPMRTAPTVTLYSPSTGTAGRVRDYGAGADRTATATVVGDTRAQIGLTAGTTTTANAGHGWHWTANAEL